jgi:hypothetical protein
MSTQHNRSAGLEQQERNNMSGVPRSETILNFVNSTDSTLTAANIPRPALRLDSLDVLLIGIALLATLPRLYLGATQHIAYDGYWHVFIAQQDRLRNFLADYRGNAHPPIFYLALKIALWFGRSNLIYRAVSLAAGIASVYVLGRVASRVMRSAVMAPVAALAFGLAWPSILISLEVRAYVLCVFFVLVSYEFFLDVVQREPGGGATRQRVAFAVFATLACLTQYCALFYVAAAWLLAMFVSLLRRREPLRRALTREAATFLPAFVLTGYEYVRHFGVKGMTYGHLPNFYFQRRSGDSLLEFVLRNSLNMFNLFSPWPVHSRAAFLAIASGCLLATALALFVLQRRVKPQDLGGIITVLIPVLIFAQLLLGGILRVYPFGGELRQQFIIFPFLALAAFVLLDPLVSAMPSRIAFGFAAALAILTAALSLRAFESLPDVREPVMKAQMTRFQSLFPAPEAVYVDQFNVITFFTFHDDWKWTFSGLVPDAPKVNLYRLTRANDRMLLLRDKGAWLLDFRKPELYRNLAAALRSEPVSSIAVFFVQQTPSIDSQGILFKADDRKSIADLSASEGLCVQALTLSGDDVYAEFRSRGCKYEQSGADVGSLSPRIEYTGAWKSGPYPRSGSGALSFTNQPGAEAAFSFHGTAITYVYTKAFNRGRARVTIDGQQRAILDLYDPKIVWRASTVFSGLPPGDHLLEVSVLNSRRPASQDTYVDIDEFVPR